MTNKSTTRLPETKNIISFDKLANVIKLDMLTCGYKTNFTLIIIRCSYMR